MSDSPLRAAHFDCRGLVQALRDAVEANRHGALILAEPQMRVIAGQLWRYVAEEGRNALIPGKPDLTLHALAAAVEDCAAHAVIDVPSRDHPNGRHGLRLGRFCLFGAGHAQLAVIIVALDRAADRAEARDAAEAERWGAPASAA